MSDGSPSFLLQAFTQSYDWGKLGSSSKAAQYARVADPNFRLDEKTPYAELWMGTHPNLPSKTLDGVPLPKILAESPSLLGSNSKGDLPFLFKVLAIRKALSIQSHPDKALAERLHREQPNVYKDSNHKPEMAIALTPFTALCGFLPVDDILNNLRTVPELAALVPPQLVDDLTIAREQATNLKSPPLATAEAHGGGGVTIDDADRVLLKTALKAVFHALMTADPALVKTQLDLLLKRYTHPPPISTEAALVDTIKTVAEQFPGDIGVFCIFFLNLVSLQPGEAIFLGAGEPHAYISGDIVECMATSDNVLRAGLTPKPRDVENLVGSLTYSMGRAQKHMVFPEPWGGAETEGSGGGAKTRVYDPPIDEFSILHFDLEEDQTEHHRAVHGPSIVIVTKGRGEMVGSNSIVVEEGCVVFIGAGEEVVWKARGRQGLEIYRAFCE
ncbi:Mannose-6-phosphate isomerase; AltName: Full=Phosphohexomutase; AltName: Full=Phosphomannose isomerase; Short=PMI [Serendipita indica DSM 11827]|nr:Mannose-6-phosphate isomerase; AltName: Full=Phosphohexomutase; AltName: Full=Phosphomannose isomerase; Short=PMI [Serendipita indica DSM 11827]